ncbi:MAG: hypothetical protein NZ699_15010 [Roseiflexus sp.]|nr:hypothetical protein [Roseiflexus sp.]MCS7290440.1 hypothetical protein [Roseiflexus sp.]MDW8147653.1 hypothetical protein [Roseiflexaceae bacterium]MDW8231504.1 hypothetical protein [Roseiflexaceae bacterium]
MHSCARIVIPLLLATALISSGYRRFQRSAQARNGALPARQPVKLKRRWRPRMLPGVRSAPLLTVGMGGIQRIGPGEGRYGAACGALEASEGVGRKRDLISFKLHQPAEKRGEYYDPSA